MVKYLVIQNFIVQENEIHNKIYNSFSWMKGNLELLYVIKIINISKLCIL